MGSEEEMKAAALDLEVKRSWMWDSNGVRDEAARLH